VVDDVCAVLWQDNNTVLLLTTIHDIQKLVLSNRKKPAATSTNARAVRKIFQERESEKLLPIPELIVDYNFFMGGVDISDQLHASYTTHRKCWRNWLALWFWLLDVTLVNSYFLYKKATMGGSNTLSQLAFRRRLVDELLTEGWQALHPQSIACLPHHTSKITQSTQYPPFHLRNLLLQAHPRQVKLSNRQLCWLCRYKKMASTSRIKSRARKTAIGRQPLTIVPNHNLKHKKDNNLHIVKTSVWCATCYLPLCDTHGYFNEFHHL